MDTSAIICTIADEIEQELQDHEPGRPATIPTTISAGLAVALLQKSIRRGKADLALAAASVLLKIAPDRLWRRLAIISIEDVGVGDLRAVYCTIAAAAHRQRLARRYGAWRLASLVVSRLALAQKCRACDDLFVVSEDCPAWRSDRRELAEQSLGYHLDIIASDGVLERRAIATRFAMATDPTVTFDLLFEIIPHTLAEIARAAYRHTGEPFCAFLPLLYQHLDVTQSGLRSDPLPPEMTVGGLPSWCLDGFSREGRKALAHFLNVECTSASWLRTNVSPTDRMKVLRHAQFRIEAGLSKDRLIWPVGERLRQHADLHSWSFPAEDAAALLSLMHQDIGFLNRSREATYAP